MKTEQKTFLYYLKHQVSLNSMLTDRNKQYPKQKPTSVPCH